MVNSNHYNDDVLTNLLRNRMGANENDVLAHVESCESCQFRLEALSQGRLTWDEVAKLLAPNDALPAGFAEVDADGSDVSTSYTTFLETSDSPESLGRFARYEILEILGRGGMGIVMRGYDTFLGRHSAVKVLAPELASHAAARRRFSREARSAAAVVHPHVVPIQTVDEHAGLPYLVMPVVEGKSVDARVHDSGPLQVIEVVRIAAQVADGLAAAHEQGLVHRDIKPANILLENGVERVVITDFGLARAIDDASMTRSGVITGTPQYMSPEQAHGDAIDHRSDLFSLGSLIYFMLSGHSPFRAQTTMGVLNRIGNDQQRSIRSINTDVPEWLEGIVTRLLEKQPGDRYQTAGEVAQLFSGWLGHLQQPALITRPLSISTQPSPSKQMPTKWLITAISAGFLFVFTTSLFMIQQDRPSRTSTQSSEGLADLQAKSGVEGQKA
ncbi:MAG: serine/threonine-protein kinase, partial [Planctomycetota bacterium]